MSQTQNSIDIDPLPAKKNSGHHKFIHSSRLKNGFTIVELIIVVAVIAVLAMVVIVGYNGLQNNARDKSLLSDIDAVESELARYAVKNGGKYDSSLNWDSSSAANQNIRFVPTSGNIILVSGYGDSYCVRAYNPASSYKNLAAAIKKGQCKVAWDSFVATSELDRTFCAYSVESILYCWGSNLHGRLGAGINGGSLTVSVPGKLADPLKGKTIKYVDARSGLVCAIAEDGNGYCWGGDSYAYGRVGNGSSSSNSPAAVSTSGVLSGKTLQTIAVGDSSVCSLASDGKAYCWGTGGGSGSKSPNAVNFTGVLAGKSAVQLANGNGSNYCVIASDQKVYCWTYPAAPTALSTSGALLGKDIASIKGDRGYCVLDIAQALYCWTGTVQTVSSTGDLVGKTVKEIETVDLTNGTCVIGSDDKAYCWGTTNTYGQLGNGSTPGSSVPVAVTTSGVLAGKAIKKITSSPAMGSSTMCALTADGKVYCWGRNNYGQLGNGSTTDSSVPVAVNTSGVLAGKTIKDIIHGGTYASCAIDTQGEMYCWGYGFFGQLGNGQSGGSTMSATPVRVNLLALE